jgi:signal transduction histidine kinase
MRRTANATDSGPPSPEASPPEPAAHASRSRLAVALLLVSMILTAVLTVEAWKSAQLYRGASDRVLIDYADLAASEYVRRATIELEHYAILPALEALVPVGLRLTPRPATDTLASARPVRPAAIPLPESIRVWIDDRTQLAIGLVAANFVLPLVPDAAGAPAPLELAGEALPPAARAWLADTVRAHVRAHFRPAYAWAAIAGGPPGAPPLLVYGLERNAAGEPVRALGFAARHTGLEVYLAFSMDIRPLLPPPLVGDVAQDSLVALAVVAPSGKDLYASAWQHAGSPWHAERSFGPQFGDLTARATLDPRVAELFVLGRLPRSRLPLLAALFLVTTGMLAVALRELRREAELNRLRSDFVSSVSHELRTPLAQIRLFAETLLLGRTRSDEERHRSLAIIHQETLRLTHLVENVLQFSRAERRRLAVARETTDLSQLAADVALGFAPLASARDAALRTEIEPGVVAAVDPGAVRQMLLNLLDNAVKYGPRGQTLTLGMQRADGAARWWVDDQGPGIPVRDRRHVWQRFSRLERGTAATPGAGIGLAVVMELARRHGGRAWVEDAPGGGARFVIAVPVDSAAAGVMAP